jgi:Mg2+ and Co2+ transporter CorA
VPLGGLSQTAMMQRIDSLERKVVELERIIQQKDKYIQEIHQKEHGDAPLPSSSDIKDLLKELENINDRKEYDPLDNLSCSESMEALFATLQQ